MTTFFLKYWVVKLNVSILNHRQTHKDDQESASHSTQGLRGSSALHCVMGNLSNSITFLLGIALFFVFLFIY